MHRVGRGGPPPRRGYWDTRHYCGNSQGGGFRWGPLGKDFAVDSFRDISDLDQLTL